jgi:type I restriction enzyme S subunit
MSRYTAYPAYRDSGVEWLGEVPAHWQVKCIRYVVDAIGDIDHFMPPSVEKGVPYLMTGDLKDCLSEVSLDDCKQVSHSDYKELSKRIKTSKGDVVMARYATIGTLMYVDVDLEMLVSYSCVTLKTNHSKMIGTYLFQYMKSDAFRQGVEHRVNTNTQGNVGIKDLQEMKVAVPPSDEQAAIAAFLDHETAKIDALIEKQQRLIELLKEKRQAVISHAVTKGLNPNAPMKDSGVEWLGEVPAHWEVATARRFLLEHKQGYYSTEDYVDDGVKLLRITDLRDLGEIDSSNSPRVKRTDALKIFLLRKGDVVFARTGGAGSFGVVPDQHEDLAYASYLIRFRFAHTYFSYPYLRFMFASDNFQLAVKENIHGGVNQNLHAEDIKNTFIAVPPIEEQEQISTYLSRQSAKYSHLIAKAESTVELMQERRSALISAAVTGKINVRDWQAST